MGHSRPLFNLFSSFQTNIIIFTTNIGEKSSSSVCCWDFNLRPSRHEYPPITRPGLQPICRKICQAETVKNRELVHLVWAKAVTCIRLKKVFKILSSSCPTIKVVYLIPGVFFGVEFQHKIAVCDCKMQARVAYLGV